MNQGTVHVICGSGSGKTSTAIGKGILALNQNKSVIMIQFLKGCRETAELWIMKRLEPDLKLFCFEKSTTFFETLTEEEKKEELINIRNGLNFAKKVLTTGECDLLILDEILGLIDQNIIPVEEVRKILESREENVDIILTGQVFPEALESSVHSIVRLENVKVDNSR